MDKGLRNTIIGCLVGFITVILTMVEGWVTINSRISVLEVQVQNNRELMLQNEGNIKEIKVMQQQILVGIQHLQDVKADKSNE